MSLSSCWPAIATSAACQRCTQYRHAGLFSKREQQRLPLRFTALATWLLPLAMRKCKARTVLMAANVAPVPVGCGADTMHHGMTNSAARRFVEAERTRVPCEAVVQREALEPGCIPPDAETSGVHTLKEICHGDGVCVLFEAATRLRDAGTAPLLVRPKREGAGRRRAALQSAAMHCTEPRPARQWTLQAGSKRCAERAQTAADPGSARVRRGRRRETNGDEGASRLSAAQRRPSSCYAAAAAWSDVEQPLRQRLGSSASQYLACSLPFAPPPATSTHSDLGFPNSHAGRACLPACLPACLRPIAPATLARAALAPAPSQSLFQSLSALRRSSPPASQSARPTPHPALLPHSAATPATDCPSAPAMCIKVVHKYGCGHEEVEKAECAKSRSARCGVETVKTVKHEEKLYPDDATPHESLEPEARSTECLTCSHTLAPLQRASRREPTFSTQPASARGLSPTAAFYGVTGIKSTGV
ncbi:hypothetical protein BKA63DRAFT_487941 [Paraphoma chrysanthemicola]|nr:hypothetical protein BKA63DRAFT_487941 [Paraphoma chrysanthemicola]